MHHILLTLGTHAADRLRRAWSAEEAGCSGGPVDTRKYTYMKGKCNPPSTHLPSPSLHTLPISLPPPPPISLPPPTSHVPPSTSHLPPSTHLSSPFTHFPSPSLHPPPISLPSPTSACSLLFRRSNTAMMSSHPGRNTKIPPCKQRMSSSHGREHFTGHLILILKAGTT